MNMATVGSYALLFFLFTLHKILHYAEAGCPFQNPFWFVEKPAVASVFDENGEMVANKVRVIWGRMENFKCVDYFQVSFLKKFHPNKKIRNTNMNYRLNTFND